MKIEAAIESLAQAERAVQEGADRLEVCADLDVGGLTPSPSLLRECVALGVPCVAMARPRAGDFVYDAVDVARLMADVESVLECGVSGVVFGVLTASGDIDAGVTRRVVHRCGTVATIFHRAFDEVRDQAVALETLIDCGVTRVLTSGGARTAVEGAERIAELVSRARGRIEILAGGSVRGSNLSELVRRSGVVQVHTRAAEPGVVRLLSAKNESRKQKAERGKA